jgi:integrase
MNLITEMHEHRPLDTARIGPDLVELAEDWLSVKNIGSRPDDRGNSDRARRSDLTRWAGAYATALNPARNLTCGGLDVWSTIPIGKLADPDVVVAVLALLAGDGLAISSRLRMLATLRGWCDWLVRRGHIDVDPTQADEVRLRWTDRDLDGKAFTLDDVDRLVQAAGETPGPRERAPWPTREIAIVSILAGCGLRVSELCNLTIRSYDTTGEQGPVLPKLAQAAK